MTQEHIDLRCLKGRTAFLIIHGIGEQNPFETVDYSVQNFIKYFEDQNLPVLAEHLVAKRRRANGYIWTESFVRFTSKDPKQDWLTHILHQEKLMLFSDSVLSLKSLFYQ
ncbi:hypothetical protein SD81_020125 [Tolypothrix campylonemoides VB511288]|nr:hypothetical protein SD81_020125 [Tolypothrix campylonemoides VB511288]